MFRLTHRESGIKVAMKEVKMEPQYSELPEVSHFTKITIRYYYEVLYLAAKMSPLKIAPSTVMVLCYALMVIMEHSIDVVVQNTTNHSNQQDVTIEVKV